MSSTCVHGLVAMLPILALFELVSLSLDNSQSSLKTENSKISFHSMHTCFFLIFYHCVVKGGGVKSLDDYSAKGGEIVVSIMHLAYFCKIGMYVHF